LRALARPRPDQWIERWVDPRGLVVAKASVFFILLTLRHVVIGGWPALEQRLVTIDLHQSLHLSRAGLKVIDKHLDVGVDFIVGAATGG
jgi:hypothetical protein